MTTSSYVLYTGRSIPYAVRASSVEPGSTVTVVASDAESVAVVPSEPPLPGMVASGFLVGGAKLQTGVRLHAKIANPDGTETHAAMRSIDVSGGEISITLGTEGPAAEAPAPIHLREQRGV